MKAKRLLAIMLAVVLIIAALSACGNSGNSGNDQTTQATTQAASAESGTEQETEAPAETETEAETQAELETVDPSKNYTLICADLFDPGTFGPYYTEGINLPFVNILYEALANVNAAGELENIIMKDYKEVGDGVYEVEIYDYVHDNKGNPVTAQDVVFSFNKATEAGNFATVLEPLKEIKAIDDYKVQMTFENERAGNFIVAVSGIKIVTEAGWNGSSDNMVRDVVGTSPYKLVDYSDGSYATFEKVDDYWQTDESLRTSRQIANVNTVKWVIISDLYQSAAAIESGEIDHSMMLNAADYSLFLNEDGSTKDGFVVYTDVNNLAYGLTFNCSENSICKDINIRKAIATAIDSNALAQSVFSGYGRAVGNYVNSAYLDYDESLEHADTYFPYDVDQAQKYLKDSGYNGEPVKVLISMNRNVRGAAVFLEAYLAAIGLNVELIQYEQAAYYSALYEESGTEWDLAFTADQGSTGNECLYSILYAADNTKNSFGNLLHVEDDKLQELYEKMASKETNSTESVKEFLDYLEENCYMYGIMEGYKVNVGGRRVKKLTFDRITNIWCGGAIVDPD